MTLPDRLRAAIAAPHTAIESTPLAVAMIAGTISREAYLGWLANMQRLHTTLENALADCPFAAGIYIPEAMNRAALLDRDRRAFADDSSDPPHDAVSDLERRIAIWQKSSPWRLLGVLYVLEGSRMGSMALVRPLARAFGVTPSGGVGLDYHLDGIATRPQRWQQFRAALAAIPLSSEQQEEVCSAAVNVMLGLCELYSAELREAVLS